MRLMRGAPAISTTCFFRSRVALCRQLAYPNTFYRAATLGFNAPAAIWPISPATQFSSENFVNATRSNAVRDAPTGYRIDRRGAGDGKARSRALLGAPFGRALWVWPAAVLPYILLSAGVVEPLR